MAGEPETFMEMKMPDRYVDIEVRLIHETDGAYLFDHGGDENVWVPKSACEYDEDTDTVTMREAMAEDKGLI